MKTLVLTLALVAFSSAPAAMLDAESVIVVPASAPNGVAQALDEAARALREAVRESTGLDLKVVRSSASGKGKAIYVGGAFAESEGFDLSDFKDFDNLVAAKDGSVYLAGRDVGRPGLKRMRWDRCLLPSVRAVARFMQEDMGVAFLAPGRTGTDIPKRDRIELPDGTCRIERPTQNYGSGRRMDMMYLMANNMFGCGLFHGYGGHTYPAACPADTYFKDHPEYFALQGGKRVADRNNPSLCISNPAVEQLVIDELVRHYDEGATCCQLGQQDGFSGCQCENCRALYGTDDWGEKLWRFHLGIAEKVAKIRPGRKVRILSYGPTRLPPKGVMRFPENVSVELCYSTESDFETWKGRIVPGGFTVYTYHWGEYPRPGFTLKQSSSDLAAAARRYLSHGVTGIYRCGYGERFGVEGRGYWVFNNLLSNPSADERKLEVDYCRRSFGDAWKPMLDFFDLLEGRVDTRPVQRRGQKLRPSSPALAKGSPLDLLAYVYSADMIRLLDAHLAKAESCTLSEKQRRRLALVRLEYGYARNLGRIATLYGAYRQAPCAAIFDSLAEALDRRRAIVDDLLSGPKGRMRTFEGWPELPLFGNHKRSIIAPNGRLGARISSPLGWDVALLREKGILPGVGKRKLDIAAVAEVPSGLDFTAGVWADVPWQELGGSQLQRIPYAARFKAVRDATSLVVACESDLADDRVVKAFGRDADVWRDESLELLVDPTGAGERIYHFVVGPGADARYDAACGLITDPLHPKFGTYDGGWSDDGWSYETARADGRWRALLRIPYRTLGLSSAPAAGDTWRFNVAREWNASCHGAPPTADALWSPDLEGGAFKNPEAMGEVTFR